MTPSGFGVTAIVPSERGTIVVWPLRARSAPGFVTGEREEGYVPAIAAAAAALSG